jgi:hypothetical protein
MFETRLPQPKERNPMRNKFASIVLVVALVFTLAELPAYANTPSEPGAKARGTVVQPDAVAEADKVVNEKLRTEIRKLVADTRAGSSVVTFPRPQIQPPQRNNLSTGTKIAIAVGVAVVVVAVIFIKRRCDNEGNC